MAELGEKFSVVDFTSAKLFRSIRDETAVTESGIYYNVPGKRFQAWYVEAKRVNKKETAYKKCVVVSITERMVAIETELRNEKELYQFALKQIEKYAQRNKS